PPDPDRPRPLRRLGGEEDQEAAQFGAGGLGGEPISPEYAAHRRRRFIMLGMVGACFLVAAAMIFGYFAAHKPWMLAVFVVAILGGFAAQGWMVMRFVQTGKPKA